MAISSSFGYARQHKIYYNTLGKHGSITLWSSYSGSSAGADPISMGKSGWYHLDPAGFNALNSLLGSTSFTEIQIGDDKDVLSLFAALESVKSGREHTFSNCDNRKISFSRSQEANEKEEIIIVKIGASDKTGKLAIGEINELERILKEILLELGYSKTEIAERLADKKQNL